MTQTNGPRSVIARFLDWALGDSHALRRLGELEKQVRALQDAANARPAALESEAGMFEQRVLEVQRAPANIQTTPDKLTFELREQVAGLSQRVTGLEQIRLQEAVPKGTAPNPGAAEEAAALRAVETLLCTEP